jgi:enamine deaminase RidA (YjgF/YER057c/UK114 family)
VAKAEFVPLTVASARALLDEALEHDTEAEVYMDDDSVDIRSRVESVMQEAGQSSPSLGELDLDRSGSQSLASSGPVRRAEREGWVCIGGVNGLRAARGPLTLEDEVHNLFQNLKGTTRAFASRGRSAYLTAVTSLSTAALHPHPLTSIQSISLFLSSMALFPLINAIYRQYFGTSPPTRACVATLLPDGERARVEAIAYVGREGERSNEGEEVGGRRGLHVQSLSYWAPANIGPYSQAVIVSTHCDPSSKEQL